ncbi:MAG: hypothetical protein PHW01_04985 [Patescibacteria group bacterium]|nr:hypothetical protein [Patescibacteria group bacterium]
MVFKSAVTMVLGMSDGGTIYRFAPDGVRQLAKADIKWDYDSYGRYWSKPWLLSFCNLAASYQGTDGCLVSGVPGADLAVCRSESEEWNPRIPMVYEFLNYTSVPEKSLKEIQDIIPPREIYLATGVHVETFQPWAQIQYMLDMGWDFESDHIESIVPLSDLISSYLTNGGAMMGGPSMYKSQGLLVHSILERLFPNFHQKIAHWPPWELGQNFAGVYPGDHDSILSRLIGFLLSPWVLWTGSWVGVARFMQGLLAKPSKTTFDAGIAFEGAGWTEAAITNTGMYGIIYKELLRRAGLKYSEVQNIVSQRIWEEDSRILDLKGLPNKAEEAVDWLVKKCAAGLKSNLSEDDKKIISLRVAIFSFIKSVAKACANDLKNVAYALGLDMPTKVAITGGWAENEFFKLALGELGIEVIVPYFAHNATHAGLAAFGLSEGKGFPQFCEAVEMIESWARKSK